MSNQRQGSVAESSVAPNHQNPNTQLLLKAIGGLIAVMSNQAPRNNYNNKNYNSDYQGNLGKQSRPFSRKLSPGFSILCESCESKGQQFCFTALSVCRTRIYYAVSTAFIVDPVNTKLMHAPSHKRNMNATSVARIIISVSVISTETTRLR